MHIWRGGVSRAALSRRSIGMLIDLVETRLAGIDVLGVRDQACLEIARRELRVLLSAERTVEIVPFAQLRQHRDGAGRSGPARS